MIKIISEIEMVIIKVDGDIVHIKCEEHDNDLCFIVPKTLFQDKSIIKYGQPVYYQVVEDQTCYDRIIKRIDKKVTNGVNTDLIKILNDINVAY